MVLWEHMVEMDLKLQLDHLHHQLAVVDPEVVDLTHLAHLMVQEINQEEALVVQAEALVVQVEAQEEVQEVHQAILDSHQHG